MHRYPSLRAVSESLTREDRCIGRIAAQITKAREIAGYTKAELARRLGISASAMTRLESGKRLPSIRMLVTLAFSTGLAVGSFFVDDNDMAAARNKRGQLGRHGASVHNDLPVA